MNGKTEKPAGKAAGKSGDERLKKALRANLRRRRKQVRMRRTAGNGKG